MRLMTNLYAVIGNPITHSRSPLIHSAFARALGEDLEYIAIDCPRGEFVGAVEAFRARGGRGLNVTAPFKVEAFVLADRRSERAEIAGAANTLKFDGKLVVADNFDGIGLVRDLTHNLGIPIAGRRILVMGAGGAARGILQPIVDEHPAHVMLVNRSPARAKEIADALRRTGPVRIGGYDSLRQGPYDLVINATSASMSGELPPISASVFTAGGAAYDLAYGLGLTPFLRLARTSGATRVVDGLGMLVEQAAEAFAWWRGVRPDTRAMMTGSQLR
jgi:shikimate dehydrogenase